MLLKTWKKKKSLLALFSTVYKAASHEFFHTGVVIPQTGQKTKHVMSHSYQIHRKENDGGTGQKAETPTAKLQK